MNKRFAFCLIQCLYGCPWNRRLTICLLKLALVKAKTLKMCAISLDLFVKNLSCKRAKIAFSGLEEVGKNPDLLVVSTFGAQYPTFCAYTEKKSSYTPD